MTNPDTTDRIITQGHALVRVIEALGTIELTGPLERLLTGLLLCACEAPVSEEVHKSQSERWP